MEKDKNFNEIIDGLKVESVKFNRKMKLSPKISELIDSLKTSWNWSEISKRMALSLLSSNKEIGLSLSQSIEEAILNIQLCQKCYVLNDQELCEICNSTNRNKKTICCRINL